MGLSKGGGYMKKETLLPQQKSALLQMLQQANGNTQQAAQGFQQFLPGGGGGEAFANAAQQRFQQQTIPQIMNAFGSGAKTSSALNQALAAGGANLNTDIASMLAQAQLTAASGLGGLGSSQSQIGLGTPGFAYTQRPPPLWQQLLGPLIGAGSQIGAAGILGSGSRGVPFGGGTNV